MFLYYFNFSIIPKNRRSDDFRNKKSAQLWQTFYFAYVPETSDAEFAPSPVPAGALQAVAAVP